MLSWEKLGPRVRNRKARRRWRFENFGMFLITSIAVRILVPISGVEFALLVHERGWRTFAFLEHSAWEILFGLLALDFSMYATHRLVHAVPMLWAFHKVHHSDPVFDFSTALRVHPADVVVGMGARFLTIILLGLSYRSVMSYELAYLVLSLFSHGNIRLSNAVEPWVGLFLVTPGDHYVHHFNPGNFRERNYGILFPWWDFLFRTWASERPN